MQGPDASARLREALEECEARFHNVIQRAADGIVIVGGDRRVRFVNAAAEELFGRSAAELVGGEFGLALVAGETVEMDVVRPGGGEPVVAELRAGDTTWEGEPAQVVSLRDVTDRRRAEAALAASKAKSDFLAVMSHELRTPLNAILGYTDLLLAGVTGAVEEGRQLRRIRVAATHLLELIEEVLAYVQMETGRERAHPAPFRLGGLVEEAAAIAGPLAREKGLELRVEVADPEAELLTDPGKLRRVVLNLLTNAVKFTGSGAVGVRAAVEGDEAVIAVSDTGPGIAPEHLERVFEPFWQAEQSLTRQSGGTGLGLSVARGLAEMLGGTVRAESEPGGGSRFVVRVPARLPGS